MQIAKPASILPDPKIFPNISQVTDEFFLIDQGDHICQINLYIEK